MQDNNDIEQISEHDKESDENILHELLLAQKWKSESEFGNVIHSINEWKENYYD